MNKNRRRLVSESKKVSGRMFKMTESMTAQQLAKEIESAVDWLKNTDEGCSTIKLDYYPLAVCVGWQDGYDVEEDDGLIHSKSDPSWVIVAGIKVWTSDSMRTDFDWINSPYKENGEVIDNDVTLEDSNPGGEATWLMVAYEKLVEYLENNHLKIEDDGKIVSAEEFEESLKEGRFTSYNDPETGWHKSPEKYKGYSIRLNSGTQTLDVYDDFGELEESGFKTFKQAKSYIDDVTSFYYPKYVESLKEDVNSDKINRLKFELADIMHNIYEIVSRGGNPDRYNYRKGRIFDELERLGCNDDWFEYCDKKWLFQESLKKSKRKVSESKNRGKGMKTLKESSGNYDYYEAVKEDIESALEEDYYKEILENAADRDDAEEELYDKLWVEDSVTGNGSGSYTYNREKARQYIKGNLSLLRDALNEFGYDPYEEDTIDEYYKDDPEKGDVTIRCYLLGEILDEVLDEYDFGGEE